ncbi:PREDICTED: carcinoembryonic antigen-related cell adhesion molecule 6 [Condylura cristata]|uniref:carcinoembryonic antigen-related cell adhesion molecule 6 n=1 Tax=Condylura cristata TaxID=143302 RepID=UPI0006432090|nr:PREDICTED: carcinoembryonic antigen-related cell adhesion molecule 6 [Condylura cristata]
MGEVRRGAGSVFAAGEDEQGGFVDRHSTRCSLVYLQETGSLLAFWVLPGAAQLTIEPEPVNAIEGGNVTLHVRGLLKEAGIFKWYKGGKVDSKTLIMSYKVGVPADGTGPAHSSRETINPNGSLLVRNVTQEDTGPYTLQITYGDFEEEAATGWLRVYPVLPKPHITSNNPDPVEHQDRVVLTCEPKTPDTTYLWSINSQSLPDSDRLQLSRGNRTLTLLPVTRADAGLYECETWNPVSARRSDPFTLDVLYGPDTPTIFPSESFYHPGDVLNLTCYADSNPPAQYSWLVSGRPQHPTQALFIPNITMSDSGAYTCQAHNNATGLNSTTVKNITVSGKWLLDRRHQALAGGCWFPKGTESSAYHRAHGQSPKSRAEPRPPRLGASLLLDSKRQLPPRCLLKPLGLASIRASSTTVTEHKDRVVLTCLTRVTGVSILWLFNTQRLQYTDRVTLSRDNRTLTIHPVGGEDAGKYQCEVSNPASSRSDPLTLTVMRE